MEQHRCSYSTALKHRAEPQEAQRASVQKLRMLCNKCGYPSTCRALSVGADSYPPLRSSRLISGGRKWLYLLALALIFLTLLLVPFTFHVTRAQGDSTPTPTLRPVSDNEVNRVAKGLYCPVCQNVPLEVCETLACERWRSQVRDLLAQGYSEQQVRDYFVTHFGPQTVGVPTDTLGQILTIMLPLGVILLLGGLAIYNVIQWRRGVRVAQAAPVEKPKHDDDDYRARLESALKERE